MALEPQGAEQHSSSPLHVYCIQTHMRLSLPQLYRTVPCVLYVYQHGYMECIVYVRTDVRANVASHDELRYTHMRSNLL